MKIAIFAPHISVWVWGLFLSYFGRAFKSQGYEVDFITCGGAIEYCTAMLGATSDAHKSAICALCKRNARWLAGGFGFSHQEIKALSKSGSLHDNDVENEIGKYAFYETILTYKTYGNLTPEMVALKDAYHKGNRVVYAAAETYFRSNTPDLTLVWNGLYSLNRTWMLAAEQKHIPAYWIHAGANRGFEFRTIMFGPKHWYVYNAEQKEHWTKAESNVRLRAGDAQTIATLVGNIVLGKTPFTYSKPKQNVRYRQAKRVGARKLVVMPTSSKDELLSAKAIGAKALTDHVFQEQSKWIQFVLDRFAESKDLFIVLRVHPREFPNHRENRHSEDSAFYSSLYEKYKESDSIHINMPEDGISLYDLLEEADLVLNAWSSVGEEAGLLGIPVVSAFKSYCNYPANLEPSYCTGTEYLDVIKSEMNAGWSAVRALRFLKWRVFSTLQSEIALSREYREWIGQSRVPFKDRFLAMRIMRQMKSERFDDVLRYFHMGNNDSDLLVHTDYIGDDEALNLYFQTIYDLLYKDMDHASTNGLRDYILRFVGHDAKPEPKIEELLFVPAVEAQSAGTQGRCLPK